MPKEIYFALGHIVSLLVVWSLKYLSIMSQVKFWAQRQSIKDYFTITFSQSSAI